MNAKTILERWETAERRFDSTPQYYTVGDFLAYFTIDTPAIATRINSLVTVYRSASGELVGCKVKGVKEMLKKYTEGFGVMITDGRTTLGLIFESLLAQSNDSERSEIEPLRAMFQSAKIPHNAIAA